MKRLFGCLAVAGLMTLAAPFDSAEAVSLLNPGAAAQTEHLSEGLLIEVHRRGGGGFRGFHGGGRHIGRAHFGHRHVHFHRRHHVHRHFVHRHIWRPRPVFVYTPPRYCRWVYTNFGPRKICRHRPWWV